MKLHFQHPPFSFEFVRILGEAVAGGSDINECFATAARITEGDFESWHQAWKETAERIHQTAVACLARGHPVSAREAFLRASNYYRCAEFFMHMEIGVTDPRARATYEKSVACFGQALPLLPFPAEEVSIPYEGAALPAYFFQVGESGKARPTLLVHGGYDSTMEEQYFETVPAALQRGYNCLTFEGPGQGRLIRQHDLPFRPDWENVVTPVVDYALTRPEVDPARLCLEGRSLGGYLAPRAAAFEHRLAACVAIDGVFSLMPAQFEALVNRSRPISEEHITAGLEQAMRQSPVMRWAICQGMWTMQAGSLADFARQAASYTLEGLAGQVTCPTLVCDAEQDHFFAGQPQRLHEALRCPKTYLRFTAEDAAEEHCHAGAALVLNQRVFDWLDETLKA